MRGVKGVLITLEREGGAVIKLEILLTSLGSDFIHRNLCNQTVIYNLTTQVIDFHLIVTHDNFSEIHLSPRVWYSGEPCGQLTNLDTDLCTGDDNDCTSVHTDQLYSCTASLYKCQSHLDSRSVRTSYVIAKLMVSTIVKR